MPQEHAVQLLKRKKAVRKIYNCGSKIFAVKFIKKDGTERFMVCRRGVQRHKDVEGNVVGLKGTGMSYDPKAYRLITVFDFAKKEYRMINELTLRELHMDGVVYKIKEVVAD